jgi:nitrite reductase (NADH) small subunit
VGTARVVSAGNRELALFHVDGEFYATQNECLHLKGPLGHGKLDGCVLSCPWHGWQYDVRTGENEFDHALALERFDVLVEDGEVKVAV